MAYSQSHWKKFSLSKTDLNKNYRLRKPVAKNTFKVDFNNDNIKEIVEIYEDQIKEGNINLVINFNKNDSVIVFERVIRTNKDNTPLKFSIYTEKTFVDEHISAEEMQAPKLKKGLVHLQGEAIKINDEFCTYIIYWFDNSSFEYVINCNLRFHND